MQSAAHTVGSLVSLLASGKAHARSTSTTIIVACIIVSIALLPAQVTAFVAGLVVGHYATPDVRDQHQARNEGERMVTAHFGRLAGLLWTWLWWLPARLIPHRSWLSHLPIVATILAAAWLYWLPLVLAWLYDVPVPWALLGWHVAGWAVQDFVHLAQDGWKVKF